MRRRGRWPSWSGPTASWWRPALGTRGIEGKIAAARYARENKSPYFGICLGMQIAVIEFARNVAGLTGANSTEFDERTAHPVIDFLPEQRSITEKGATMRLGAYPCLLEAGTKSATAYGATEVSERHRHRYEVNNTYRELLMSHGLIVSGTSPDRRLVEMVELPDHPYFVGCQFHPEFKSRPQAPAPCPVVHRRGAPCTRGAPALPLDVRRAQVRRSGQRLGPSRGLSPPRWRCISWYV